MASVPTLVKYGPPSTSQSSSSQEVLNSVIPPREWRDGEKLWVQFASPTPATNSDVLALEQQLNAALSQRQARETGICPVREELFDQAMLEIIRQVTIGCAERGLLLLRARDEKLATVHAYQQLYESSVSFGMRKALLQERTHLEAQAADEALAQDVSKLEAEIFALHEEVAQLRQKDADQTRDEEAKHAAEVETLTKHNQHLKDQLETLLSVPKKL
jgi:dynein light intermediate chain